MPLRPRCGAIALSLIFVLSGFAGCGGSGGADDASSAEPVAPAVPTDDTTGAGSGSDAADGTDDAVHAADPGVDPQDPAPLDAPPVSTCATSGTSLVAQIQLLASNPDAGDRFGSALAMSDTTIAVAAEGEASKASGFDGNRLDNSVANAGAVYLWECESGSWRQTHYLKAPSTAQNDYFGSALALSGDTLIVGAKGRTVAGKSHVGAAFVYRKSPAGWQYVATLTEPALSSNALFGHSVAVDGELAAVGAPGDNNNAGALFFYRRSGDGWTREDSAAGASGAYLGRKLALAGDTVVSNSLGAALVYARSARDDGSFGWSRRAALSGTRSLYGRESKVTFGPDAAVAIAADRIVVTSPAAPMISAINAGIACAFQQVGGVWVADGYCFAPSASVYRLENMFFGQSGAAILPNDRIAVTADADSSAGVGGHGSVFVFGKADGLWVQQQYILSPSGPQKLVNFGFSGIAAAGGSLLVSEQLHSGTAASQGAAYLFRAQ